MTYGACVVSIFEKSVIKTSIVFHIPFSVDDVMLSDWIISVLTPFDDHASFWSAMMAFNGDITTVICCMSGCSYKTNMYIYMHLLISNKFIIHYTASLFCVLFYMMYISMVVHFTLHCMNLFWFNYNDVIMSAMAYKMTSLTIVYWIADQRKHQNFASLSFVRWIYRWAVNFPHKRPVRR